MNEEQLRVVASVIDWSVADKMMYKVFRNTFVTTLNGKFAEFSQTKAAIKDFVNENFPDTIGDRTPVRYNPTTKLRSRLQEMLTVRWDEDRNFGIVSKKFPAILKADKLRSQPTPLPSPPLDDTPPFQLMSSYSTCETEPIIPEAKTPSHETNDTVPLSAKTPAQNSLAKYAVDTNQLYETPLSGGRKVVRFANMAKSSGNSSGSRLMHGIFVADSEKHLAASAKRAALLEQRAARIRDENEKCFQRVRENLSRKSPTPVPYLRPICDAPRVQVLRWDEGNATPDESPNATSVIENSDVVTAALPVVLDTASDAHTRPDDDEAEDLNNNTCVSAVDDLSEDVLNEAIVNFSDIDGLADCTQKSSPRSLTKEPEEEDELFVSACCETPPCSPIVVRGTPILEPDDSRLKSTVLHQRTLVDEAQIRRHFGSVRAPTLNEIFNRDDVCVTVEDENSNWQATDSYWKNNSNEPSGDA